MQFEAMVALALHSTDELFHVHLYTWLRSVEMVDRLVEVRPTSLPPPPLQSNQHMLILQIKTPFIEDYLKYAAATQVSE